MSGLPSGARSLTRCGPPALHQPGVAPEPAESADAAIADVGGQR
jgi:hypothetical protein